MNIEPPPMPMLWGFMIDVHSKVAMAPSTADPPDFRISLGERKKERKTENELEQKFQAI